MQVIDHKKKTNHQTRPDQRNASHRQKKLKKKKPQNCKRSTTRMQDIAQKDGSHG